MTTPIYVTQPSLAPLDEFQVYLAEIWRSGIMTHHGPLVQRLEKELGAYLNVRNVVCVSNGTCALQLALHGLDITGEVITSPFTYIATANVIRWERCRPVFVDINPDDWTLDPGKIEAAITDKTSAILPVHIFSRPCDTTAIQSIADRHNLRVIYDAAHAMAVQYKGRSLLSHGDITGVSFHATKLFNTAEGGACITDDDELAERMRRLRFFGFNSNKEIVGEGINAKMTEVHAALGLANLKYLDQVIENRKVKCEQYRTLFRDMPFIKLQQCRPESYNYSYMPVVFDTEERLLRVMKRLNQEQIYPMRYFYPSLNTCKIFTPKKSCPIAEDIARRILCLPIYDRLEPVDIERIVELIDSRP